MVLGAGSSRSQHQQGWFLLRAVGDSAFTPLSWLLVASAIPWLAGAILPMSSHCLPSLPACLCVQMSPFIKTPVILYQGPYDDFILPPSHANPYFQVRACWGLGLGHLLGRPVANACGETSLKLWNYIHHCRNGCKNKIKFMVNYNSGAKSASAFILAVKIVLLKELRSLYRIRPIYVWISFCE